MEAMEVYLHTVGHVIALIVQAIALFLVAAGTVGGRKRPAGCSMSVKRKGLRRWRAFLSDV